MVSVEIGVNGPDEATAKALPELGETMKKLSLYKHYFESKFLNKTRQYYAQEAGQLVQQNPVTAYMEKVSHFLVLHKRTNYWNTRRDTTRNS